MRTLGEVMRDSTQSIGIATKQCDAPFLHAMHIWADLDELRYCNGKWEK